MKDIDSYFITILLSKKVEKEENGIYIKKDRMEGGVS